MSGQWLRSWGKEWVCDFLTQLKDSRHSYEMVERNTDFEQSLIFLKDSEVTRIL